MSSETLTVACAVTIFLVAVFGLVYYALDRSRVRESAAYERVFAVLMQDGRDLRDRMYVEGPAADGDGREEELRRGRGAPRDETHGRAAAPAPVRARGHRARRARGGRTDGRGRPRIEGARRAGLVV
jgi:hypothetical protein